MNAAPAHFAATDRPESKRRGLRRHRSGETRTMALAARRLDGEDPNMALAPGLFIAAFLSFCGVCHAAGSASGTARPAAWADPASGGAACSVGAPVWAPPAATAEDLPWTSVWLGHFSGGRRFEAGSGQIFIDWRDAKLCFPSRQECQAWITGLRRAYRRPEGFWTCLLLR
ncbi:MAG: hypothetical protein M3Z96_14240 [Pseudomonadota bacterium]|nr:hypothetical protein [Pseudomonadota bacterium]